MAPLAPGGLGDLVVRQDGRLRHVVVDGRVVVEEGRLVAADAAAVEAEARREAAGLWARMARLATTEGP